MTQPPRPVRHLSAYSERYPQAWQHLEDMRSSKGRELPHWEAWCFVPLAAAYAIVSGGGDNRVPLERAGDVSALAALAAWRMTKGIYRFDPDIMAELRHTPVTGDVPAGVLTRLPEWCVYLETPGRTVMDTPPARLLRPPRERPERRTPGTAPAAGRRRGTLACAYPPGRHAARGARPDGP